MLLSKDAEAAALTHRPKGARPEGGLGRALCGSGGIPAAPPTSEPIDKEHGS
jgi:hypothetical protein